MDLISRLIAQAAFFLVPRMKFQSAALVMDSHRTAPLDSRSISIARFTEHGLRPYAMFVMCWRDVPHREANLSRSLTDIAMKNDFSSMGGMITEQLMESNNYLGNSQAVIPMAQYAMDTKEIRRLRLRQIIDERYDGFAGQFADAHGFKRPQVSRWVTENAVSRQGISEQSARAIETREGKPSGWMDSLGENQDFATMAPLAGKFFALPCTGCGKVSHQSFIDLEMNDSIPCPSCGNTILVADYYGQTDLAEFLKSIGATGFVLRTRKK